METVVITGSTRGIGRGLALEFLKRGYKVVISGRKPADVELAVSELKAHLPGAEVSGLACDVTDLNQVQALWDLASHAGRVVNLWINNAGVGQDMHPFDELPIPEARQVITTNIIGTMNGCSVALKGMQAQGCGAIYNMHGLGSDGRIIKGMSVYGTSKAGLAYFTRALAAETRGGPVLVGALAPGMVLTDLLLKRSHASEQDEQRMKKVFNILAERVEVVTPWLVERMIANQKHGAVLSFSSPLRMLGNLVGVLTGRRDQFREQD